MMKTIKINKLITHDGPFHSDDVFACATLCLMLENKGESYNIIRTRDEKIIQTGDYIFDIGGVHNEQENQFDHHQKGGAGKRENGIEYASFGLVWKKFGLEISGSESVAKNIDERLVSPIDAGDNGIDLLEKKYDISPFLIQDFFKLMRPTWKENQEDIGVNFLKTVDIAKEVLVRSITHGKDTIIAEEIITKAYEDAKDKKIIILDRYYPFGKVFEKLPETLFVIFPRDNSDIWAIKAINMDGKDFENRKDFPQSWAGLSDQDLAKVTGVSDSVFCHRGLFIANAKSKEGAMKLAQIAVES